MRLIAAPVVAALMLLGGGALAGTFGDLSSMGAKFPKINKENQEGQILVRFKSGTTAQQRDDKHRREGNTKLRELKLSGVHVVQVSPDQTLEQALAKYTTDAIVAYAEPNYVIRAMRLPNEPAFNLLWSMQNIGQTLGTPGADIKATLAWDRVTGSAGVAVMVIDSGVDYTHQDLVGNIWVNPGEIPGNGIDDDGNGYIDDVNGIDVVNGDSDPMDDYGHGSHVAGTIGAVGNNALGVVGVNWAVKMIPCKVLDAVGNGTIADAVACLEYARVLKSRGVNIVATNNSYGGLGSISQTMSDAVNAQRDILFIAAAGNFGTDNDAQPFFPANIDLPNVISVAATDHSDLKPAFSNFGRRSVHIGAPGVNITSTTPFNNYAAANGTSMSTPHVTGLAALLKAQNTQRDWRAIKNLLLAGGDVRPSMAQSVSGRRLSADGATACTNRPLFSVLKLPAAFSLNQSATVSALSINCASSLGAVTAASSAGQTFTLADDGVAPDLAAGDGIFTATWTPTLAFASLTVSSPAGTETITMLDLTVSAVSGPASANRGDTVTMSLTVRNPSSMAAPASSANLYLSVDGVITSADTLLATVPVPALGAGEQQVLTTGVTLPSSTPVATYFYGAVVDPANAIDEASETNNARAGNTVAVGNVAADLVVLAVSGPASAFNGDVSSFSTTVTNRGSSTAGSSQVNFYLSTDAVITSADTWIGSAAIGALAPGQSQVAAGALPIPVTMPAGTYYVGAIADATGAVVETDETNNVASGNTVTLSTRPIDLVLTAVSGPSTAKDTAAVTLSATVKNVGTADAQGSTLRWYLSTDATITTADIAIANVSIGQLRAGGQVKVSTTVQLPANLLPGTYRLGAIVDPDNTLAEINNGNNALTGGTLAVSYTVDLAMSAVSGPTVGATGQNVALSGTVRNQGLAATPGNVTVGFYVSADAAITAADTLVGTVSLPSIAPGASVPVTLTAALNTALRVGTYYVGAIVDPGAAVPESNEGNNAAAGNTIVISYGPDLVVTAVTAPASATRGGSVSLSGTVANQGQGALGALSDQNVGSTASAVRLGFYMSTNATITANDTFIGSVLIPALAPGQSVPLSVTVTLSSNLGAGTYYIGAIADYSNGIREVNEGNNARTGNVVTVR